MIAKIVIASTLKPITDPRAFEKIGDTLAESGLYHVHIMGSYTPIHSTPRGITLHPHAYPDSILARLKTQINIFRKLLKLRPSLLIITTHELLLPGILFKLITAGKLIYDIQENYNFNLRYQKIYPWGLRHLMALYIRTKEYFAAPFINRFFLAEECYFNELSFIRQSSSLLLENKFSSPASPSFKEQEKFEFLLSGTISELYGVYEALSFTRDFPPTAFDLVIIGHCPDKRLREELVAVELHRSNVILKVSDQPVAHEEILAEIGPKTIGLLPYSVNKSTQNKIPTKLYEYLGLGIPLLISKNNTWEKTINSYSRAQSIDFHKPVNIAEISQFIYLNEGFHPIDSERFMWSTYKKSLLQVIQSVL